MNKAHETFQSSTRASLDWTLPYASRRHPILARYVVSTSQPLATQAGMAMLHAGGNAVDAALATAIALTICEPCSNGLGSDLFAIIWDGGELDGLNASGRAPAAWSPARYEGQRAMPRAGWTTVTIPGAVSGWIALSKRFGKLPFADLFGPAIRYARDGYAVSPVVGEKWAKAVPILGNVPGFAEHFLPRGRAPQPGELFASPAMAATMEKIARTGGDSFYRGDLAEAMVEHSRQHDGGHSLADFEAHTCEWVTPLAHDYHGCTVHEIPPNGQGIAALMALGILENFDLHSYAVDSVEVQHLEIEAMKLAFADAYRYVADPRSMTVTPAQLLDRDYLASRARLIDRSRAQDFRHGLPPPAGTVYLAARRRERDDGVADPVELHGIRVRHRGAGHRYQPAEPRHRFFARERAPEYRRRRQNRFTPSSGLCHPRGQPYCSFRRHGRSDPAAGRICRRW